MQIQKVLFGLFILTILGLCMPLMGLQDANAFKLENKCDKKVNGTVRINYLTPIGVQGQEYTETFSLEKNGGVHTFSVASDIMLCPNKIDAYYGSSTEVIRMFCFGTPDECCTRAVVTYKMSGSRCISTSDKSYWHKPN